MCVTLRVVLAGGFESELSVVESLELLSTRSETEEVEEEASVFGLQQPVEQSGKVGSGGFELDDLSTFSDLLSLATGTVGLGEGRAGVTLEVDAEEGMPPGGINAPGKPASTAAGTYSCSMGRTPQILQR